MLKSIIYFHSSIRENKTDKPVITHRLVNKTISSDSNNYY